MKPVKGGIPNPREEKASGHELPIFEEAISVHLDSLFAFAMRLTRGRREAAEDLVQDACLRAFKNFGSLRSPEKIKSWLFQILVNTNINNLNRRSRQITVVEDEIDEEMIFHATVGQAPTPEESFLKMLPGGELQEALDSLPIDFRTIVWLSDVEELSYKEISEITNCPMGTIASRLYRGRSLLRERLRDYARKRGLIKE